MSQQERMKIDEKGRCLDDVFSFFAQNLYYPTYLPPLYNKFRIGEYIYTVRRGQFVLVCT
jgi:hypothetical protein